MNIAAIIAALALATPAAALTYDYRMTDYDGPSRVGDRCGCTFGLVNMDNPHPNGGGWIFGFEDVRLRYNDQSGTARLSGDLIDRKTGETGYSVDYHWSHLTDTGSGTWIDTAGKGHGRVSYAGPGAWAFSLGAQDMNGLFGAFGPSGHGFGLHAWTGGDPGPNDFMALAAQVPLPAGWALLLGALAGLGLARRALV